jgi:thioesterase domain-containing protein
LVWQTRNSSSHGIRPKSLLRDQFELVPIQPKGSQIPLYVVHELFGDIECYGPLSRALGDEQPIYAFRSLVHDHAHTIEEIAASYLSYLRAFDPVGPYLVGGYSFGGQIAFEMARQLSEDGEQAKLVFMFDSWILGSGSKLPLREQARTFLHNAKIHGASYVIRKIENKWNYWRRGPERAFLKLIGTLCERLNMDKPRSVIRAQIEMANRKALYMYRPHAYEGQVLLMIGTERQELVSRRGDPFHGWGVLADKRLEICSIPADHVAFLNEPSVQIVAETLRSRLCWHVNQRDEAQSLAHE